VESNFRNIDLGKSVFTCNFVLQCFWTDHNHWAGNFRTFWFWLQALCWTKRNVSQPLCVRSHFKLTAGEIFTFVFLAKSIHPSPFLCTWVSMDTHTHTPMNPADMINPVW